MADYYEISNANASGQAACWIQMPFIEISCVSLRRVPSLSLTLCPPRSLTQLNGRFKIHATFFFYATVIKFNTCPAIPTRRLLLLLLRLLLSLRQLGVCVTQWAKLRIRCVCCRKSFLDSAYTHTHPHTPVALFKCQLFIAPKQFNVSEFQLVT